MRRQQNQVGEQKKTVWVRLVFWLILLSMILYSPALV